MLRNQWPLLEMWPRRSSPMPPPQPHLVLLDPQSPLPSVPPFTPSPEQCQPSCLGHPILQTHLPTRSSLAPSRASSLRVAYPSSRTGTIMLQKTEGRWLAPSHPYQSLSPLASPNPHLPSTRRHQSRLPSFRAPQSSGPRTPFTQTNHQAAPQSHQTPILPSPLQPPRLCHGSVGDSCRRPRPPQRTLPRSCQRLGQVQV